jgi:hypothetical protein
MHVLYTQPHLLSTIYRSIHPLGINKYMHNYYTYTYLREDGTPYYIGKGTGKRAWSKQHRINLPTTPDRIQIINDGLTNDEAKAQEIALISKYGRKDLGTGILHNQTAGGDGARLCGQKNGMFGKKHSNDARAIMREKRHMQVMAPRTEKQRKELSERQKATGGYGPKQHTELAKQKNRNANLGKCVGVNKEGQVERVLTTDPRWSTGELHGVCRGVKKTDDHRAKLREAALKRPPQQTAKCEHCGTIANLGNYKRWHGEKCKLFTDHIEDAVL